MSCSPNNIIFSFVYGSAQTRWCVLFTVCVPQSHDETESVVLNLLFYLKKYTKTSTGKKKNQRMSSVYILAVRIPCSNRYMYNYKMVCTCCWVFFFSITKVLPNTIFLCCTNIVIIIVRNHALENASNLSTFNVHWRP